jgi:hypothetical protein
LLLLLLPPPPLLLLLLSSLLLPSRRFNPSTAQQDGVRSSPVRVDRVSGLGHPLAVAALCR